MLYSKIRIENREVICKIKYPDFLSKYGPVAKWFRNPLSAERPEFDFPRVHISTEYPKEHIVGGLGISKPTNLKNWNPPRIYGFDSRALRIFDKNTATSLLRLVQ